MLAGAKKAFDRANVVGRVHNTSFNPASLAARYQALEIQAMIREHRRPQDGQAWARRVAGTVVDSAAHTHSSAYMLFGMSLQLPPFPLFWDNILPLTTAAGLAPLYPAGDLLFGRGHEPSIARAGDTVYGFGHSCVRAYNTCTQYGLLGTLLEAAPRRLSEKFESRGQLHLAAACMTGAVVGRGLLQVPRLLLLSAALINQGFIVVLFAAGMFTGQLASRGVYAIARDVSALGGYDLDRRYNRGRHHPWANMPMHIMADMLAEQIDHADITIDPGGPGVNTRVQNRVSHLIGRFQPLLENDAASSAEIMSCAEEIATDLRRYCSQQPDTQALRGGLRNIKDFVDLTWEPNKGVVFNPPELHYGGEV